jgi:hypothetical protein
MSTGRDQGQEPARVSGITIEAELRGWLKAARAERDAARTAMREWHERYIKAQEAGDAMRVSYDDLMALAEKSETHRVEAERRAEAAEKELEKWREREAAVCPEDVPFGEYIGALQGMVAALRAAMLVRFEDGRLGCHGCGVTWTGDGLDSAHSGGCIYLDTESAARSHDEKVRRDRDEDWCRTLVATLGMEAVERVTAHLNQHFPLLGEAK